jgi:HK97 family phage portal protein
LRYPNAYETWSQFIFNVGAEVGFEGESLALKVRDSRNAVAGFHRVPRRGWSIHVDPETKEIFYGLNDTDLYHKPEMLVPQREVVHFRQHCPRHPLIGESSVKASALSVGINVALSKSQLYFFNQMARPSGVLSTDLSLNAEQVSQLRARFDDQSKYWNQGRVPILTNGLKWAPVNISQADSQLIEQQRLSALEVARVFSVPMALLAEGSGPQAGTAALITTWLSLGLGSLIENIERSLDRAFELPANEHIQLDTTPLLRSDPGSRAEMWSKNIQSGTMTINEVRLREGLAPVEGGDTPMVQQQMVGIDLLQQLHAATIASKLKPKADPDPDPAPAAAPPKDDDKEFDGEVTRALIVDMFKRKRA